MLTGNDTPKMIGQTIPLVDRSNVRAVNRALNITEFQCGQIKLQSLPLALFVELTQNCNLNCSYCRAPGRFETDWNMPLQLFQRVAEELFSTAMLVDLRGRGESTILKQFPDFVSITASYGPQIRLVTNGMNPDERIWDQLMAVRAMVVISCDAADPVLFSQLRTGGDLGRLCQTVRTIVRFRDRYGVPPDYVYFTTVVSQPNVEHLPTLVEMAHKLGLQKVTLFPVVIAPAHPWHLRHDLDATRRGLATALARADSLGVTLQLGVALDDSLRLLGDVQSLCVHPWAYALVDYAGRVGFCDCLIGNSRHTFGTLYKKSFREIWNGSDFRALRAAHIRHDWPDRFSPCRYCYHMRYVDLEHLIHTAYAAKLVSNRTRPRLYEDGVPMIPVPEFH